MRLYELSGYLAQIFIPLDQEGSKDMGELYQQTNIEQKTNEPEWKE